MKYFILIAGKGVVWEDVTNGLAACKRLLQFMDEFPRDSVTLYRCQEIITEVIR